MGGAAVAMFVGAQPQGGRVSFTMAAGCDFEYASSQAMRIGDLAGRVGIRTSAIRYYEARGLLAPPARVSGRREYGPAAVNTLRLVLAAQRAGFTLAETRGLLGLLARHRSSTLWKNMAATKLRELDATIVQLSTARDALTAAIDCECAGVADACALVTKTGAPVAAVPAPRRRATRGHRADDRAARRRDGRD